MPEALKNKYGAFVTLKIKDKLRGCIGRFISEDPLYEVIKQSSISFLKIRVFHLQNQNMTKQISK